jgi:hypothetical protein
MSMQHSLWRTKEGERGEQATSPGSPRRGGKLSTVDLLVQASLDLLAFMLKALFAFVTQRATLLGRPTVLSLPPQLAFPDLTKATAKAVELLLRTRKKE